MADFKFFGAPRHPYPLAIKECIWRHIREYEDEQRKLPYDQQQLFPATAGSIIEAAINEAIEIHMETLKELSDDNP